MAEQSGGRRWRLIIVRLIAALQPCSLRSPNREDAVPTKTFSKRFHHNGAQKAALSRAFTDAFIASHIAGGDHEGPVTHRARTNDRVPMSTVVSYGDAVTLGQEWLRYVSDGSNGQTRFTVDPVRPGLFTYTTAVRVMAYDKDADGEESDAWIRFTKNRNDPDDQRIHHLERTEFTDPSRG